MVNYAREGNLAPTGALSGVCLAALSGRDGIVEGGSIP